MQAIIELLNGRVVCIEADIIEISETDGVLTVYEFEERGTAVVAGIFAPGSFRLAYVEKDREEK